MKTIIKIGYSETTKCVLAETKLEVEYDSNEGVPMFKDVQDKAKEIFEDAQIFALQQTMKRM